MCLANPQAWVNPPASIIAYKIVSRKYDASYHPPRAIANTFLSLCAKTEYKVGKTYEAKPADSSRVSVGSAYDRGFHVYLSLKEAKRRFDFDYAPWDRKTAKEKNRFCHKIIKVRLSNLTYRGNGNTQAVGLTMKILGVYTFKGKAKAKKKVARGR